MAIGINNIIDFFGTQDDLYNDSSTVTDTSFSVAADLLSWTNTDNARMATIVLNCTFSVAPDVNSFINLYARPLNVNSTSDQETPSANFPHDYLGSFPLNNVTTEQNPKIVVALDNTYSSQQYEFYVENRSGQTIPAYWRLLITPKTVGVKY